MLKLDTWLYGRSELAHPEILGLIVYWQLTFFCLKWPSATILTIAVIFRALCCFCTWCGSRNIDTAGCGGFSFPPLPLVSHQGLESEPPHTCLSSGYFVKQGKLGSALVFWGQPFQLALADHVKYLRNACLFRTRFFNFVHKAQNQAHIDYSKWKRVRRWAALLWTFSVLEMFLLHWGSHCCACIFYNLWADAPWPCRRAWFWLR